MTMKPSLEGLRFGRLLVSHRVGAGKRHKWVCVCDCGGTTEATYTHLTSGDTKSCGCLRKEVTAALGRSRRLPGRKSVEYKAWVAIKGRCYNSNHQDFPNYGGRGIEVSNAWQKSYEQFHRDMGPRPRGMSIDRINVNGNYEYGNCRWATSETQANNKRASRYVEYMGLTLTVAQWAKKQGMSKQCLLERLDAGWSVDDALHTPVGSVKVYNKPRVKAQFEAAIS